jgi:hypothetical protein
MRREPRQGNGGLDIRGHRFRSYGAFSLEPTGECFAQIEFGIRADEPFRQISRLDEKKPMVICFSEIAGGVRIH